MTGNAVVWSSLRSYEERYVQVVENLNVVFPKSRDEPLVPREELEGCFIPLRSRVLMVFPSNCGNGSSKLQSDGPVHIHGFVIPTKRRYQKNQNERKGGYFEGGDDKTLSKAKYRVKSKPTRLRYCKQST